jgi:Tfp pilus assembly protein PilZ
MHAEIETMDLPQLVERLEDLEERRTPVGWSPDDAVERAAVERRILAMVGARKAQDERRQTVRLPCRLAVVLRSRDQAARGEVRDLGSGGVFVATDAELGLGTHVHVEVRGLGTDEHGLRVRGKIAWHSRGEGADPAGVGVRFDGQPSDAHERRLRRFVIELLRTRLAD